MTSPTEGCHEPREGAGAPTDDAGPPEAINHHPTVAGRDRDLRHWIRVPPQSQGGSVPHSRTFRMPVFTDVAHVFDGVTTVRKGTP